MPKDSRKGNEGIFATEGIQVCSAQPNHSDLQQGVAFEFAGLGDID
jgi:hypothetical protein